MLKKYIVFLLACSLTFTSWTTSNADKQSAGKLFIDPQLVLLSELVWNNIAVKNNQIWSGWDASSTPILFYIPNEQDVLINHPAPPPGFIPYTGPVKVNGFNIWVKSGETLIPYDGQNTTMEIAEVQSLVVADSLSNRKNSIAGMLYDPRSPMDKLQTMTYSDLISSPYQTMAMIAHEAFHAYQMNIAPEKSANEQALKDYPVLSIINNTGFALEGIALNHALTSNNSVDVRKHLIDFLAIRLHRRNSLSENSIAYEDAIEFSEGLAKYIEYRMSQVIEGQDSNPYLDYQQGFYGLADLSSFRGELLDMMLKHMKGEVNVNNAPYGAAPLRMRLYFSGMGIAAVLDKLGIDDWQNTIITSDVSLTQILKDFMDMPDETYEKAYSELTNTPDFKKFHQLKAKLNEQGILAAQDKLNSLIESEFTGVVIDFSEIEALDMAMGYSPFGVTRLNDSQIIYEQVPIAARIRKGSIFQQTVASPVLEDLSEKVYRFNLTKRLSTEDIASSIKENFNWEKPVILNQFDLPGVSMNLGKVSLSFTNNTLHIKLLND